MREEELIESGEGTEEANNPPEVEEKIVKKRGGSSLMGKTPILPRLPGFPEPPDFGTIKEVVDTAVEGLQEMRTAPKTILETLKDADGDFREANKALKGVRFRKGK